MNDLGEVPSAFISHSPAGEDLEPYTIRAAAAAAASAVATARTSTRVSTAPIVASASRRGMTARGIWVSSIHLQGLQLSLSLRDAFCIK
jgi:hypothetical protein